MEVSGDPDDFMPVFENLTDRPLRDAVQNVITQLQNDIPIGNHIHKSQIPKYYIRKHNVQVLFRVDMPHYWRLIYTIFTLKDHAKRVILLELFDHDGYNKRFGYYKKGH